jgi:type I restriction enzyme S subunit
VTSLSAFKPSALRFVHEIPSHWVERRAKFIFKEVNERSTDGTQELLSVSHITGVTRRSEKNVTMIMAETTEGYKVCRPGDLAINTLWAWMGALGVSPECGVVSPAYGVYRQREPKAYRDRFVDLLLRTPVLVAEYNTRSRGVQDSRMRLYPESFLDIPLPCPSLGEQDAIVRFLEERERDIEHYLATKRRMIQEYNERETALASNRFDDLIRDFRSVRLKDVCEITSGYSFESSGFVSDPDGVRLVRGANVGIGHLRWTDENTVRWPAASVPAVERWSLQAGDLVIGLNRPWIDGGLRLAEVRREDLPCLVLQRVARLRARPSVLSQFLSLMLRTPRLLWELEPDFTGVGTPYIDEHRMKRFRIPLPPLSKQREIVDLHASETREIGNALRVLEREIALMEEYRTRLIADAVTGQIDVRRSG